jgi:hypothetical protein
MEYLAADEGDIEITLGEEVQLARVEEGLNELQFVIVGGGDQLTITPPDDAGVCVAKVEIGQPEGPA